MNVKNFAFSICCCVLVVGQLGTSNCHGQDNDHSQRISSGKKFLTPSRIAKWESHFTRALNQLGRIEYQAPSKMLSESWFDGQFYLVKLYSEKSKSVSRIDILNEKYLASIEKKNEEYYLESFRGRKLSSEGYTTVPVTLVPFAIPSAVPNYHEVVPTFLRDGRMEIGDYHQEGNRHFFTFVFTEDSGHQPIDMVFDETISSCLPVETTRTFEDIKEVLTSFDFTEINGYNIPLKFSCVEEGGRNQSYTIRTDIYPDDRLDREKCYLSFYGLPEPPIQEISDFGRRGTNMYLIGVIIAIFLLLISFAIQRIRRSQR